MATTKRHRKRRVVIATIVCVALAGADAQRAGRMPADGPANCLKFLAEGDPKIEPAKIKLADTWTNEFAQRAKKHS